MTRNKLLAAIAAETGLSKVDVDTALKGFVSVVKNEMSAQGKVFLKGFGTFTGSTRTERTALHPITRTKVKVPGKRVMKFKTAPSAGL